MRSKRLAPFVAVLSVAVLAGTVVAYSNKEARTPNGVPDISGQWSGKLSGKNYDMTGAGDTEKSKAVLSMTITQNEGNLSIDVTLTPESGIAETFTLTGNIGHDNFWATGRDTTTDISYFFTGHLKSEGTKMKGMALSRENDACGEFKFSASKL